MHNKLIILPVVASDLVEAREWYDKQRLGLGDEFSVSVMALLESIKTTPESFAPVKKQFRRAMVKRFPYSIFFEYDNNVIVVYGLVHDSRDEIHWRKRLRE
ncbi:MAG: type II toxin-antitoxin system RelE/ParE family toxin [Planctomycetota bacterium]|nr:type II toxin-antitoxin system RelE/ParE family toxin [Planctomycetota bacterium]MDA1213069.1 type II toxin-antitoxin system RelE/ParE family toxin [Planctomycetota bacterium]